MPKKKRTEGSRTTLQQKYRAIQLSLYCHTIIEILSLAEELSVPKTIFLAFLCKTREREQERVYDGKQRKDLLTKVSCEAAGKFDQLTKEFRYIVEAISILIKTKYISVTQEKLLRINPDRSIDRPLRDDALSAKLINSCLDHDDAYVVQEVLRNV